MPIKKVVLIVDSDYNNRLILKDILDFDYKVLQVENGKEALEVLRREKDNISVVLLNITVPVEECYNFLVEKIKDPELVYIPVMVTAEKEDEAIEVEALSRGAAGFLVKPYRQVFIFISLPIFIKLRKTLPL